MGFQDTQKTELQLGFLDLGLNLHDQSQNCKNKKIENPSRSNNNKADPSLTLGPSDEDEENDLTASKTEYPERVRTQVSSPSAVSSFSNSCSIKREFEVEKVQTKFGDVDEDGSTRKKLRLSKEQSAVLEENFRQHSTLNPKQKQELARKLNLRTRQVEVWFQNRRARTKLKQTESDCELLKKCCATLTEENKKLQKELQELKSIKLTAATPLYMPIPAATLTICPACERIICDGNSVNGNGISSPTTTTTTLLVGSNTNHHYYNNPFSHSSSTAC